VLRVGLTGGIACGKSHVLARLAGAGLATLDLDRVAHSVMDPGGAAYADVVASFGHEVLDTGGAIDRKRLAAIVFADEAARLRLNALVHPRVRDEEERRVAEWGAAGAAAVVTDAALLVEAGLHLRFDRLVVVHCSPDEQLRRLMARDGIDAAAARARIGTQLPAAEKRRYAHFEVDTSGSVVETEGLADRLAVELLALTRRPRASGAFPLAAALGCVCHGPSAGPRGMDPMRLLAALAGTQGLEMEALAARLVPQPTRPWFQAARRGEPGPVAAALAGPLALWVAARRAADPAVLAAAAASVARLLHVEPDRVADAVLQSLALLGAVLGRIPEREELVRSAARWGGARPSAVAEAALDAAERHPWDVEAARAACRDAGGEPDQAAALVGAQCGLEPDQAPRDLISLLRRLAERP
jgi:dephospho-CoA kinase